MNNSIKFNVYSLKFKEMLRCGRGMRFMLLLAALIFAVLPAWAQQYVFLYKNGNTYNFMYNNSGSIGNTTTFNANTCVWTGTGTTSSTFTNNGSSLNRNSSTLRINTASTFVITTYGRVYYDAGTDRYIQYSSGWTTMAQNNNPGTGAQYTVLYTYTSQEASLSDPVITGNGSLTATGSFNYSVSATGAPAHSQFSGYNSTTAVTYYYYNSAMSTQAPSSNVTSGTWSLDDNGADVSFNTSTGAITVNTLPATDITMTLTCSVTSNGITKTATKEVTIQGTKPAAPIISVSGTTVTLSTNAVGSTTIRYTLDGTDPTTTTGTVYSSAIDLSGSSTSPVTIKAITVRNGNASDVSTEVVTLTLPTPVITANAAAGTATIACATAGVTIHYTTDGSTPTTSSTTYSSFLSGLSPMTTIKAIAVKDGWNNSAVASETMIIPSGASGGVVTLFDYEDHNWTYYSGVSSDVDGGSYNTTYNGTLYSPNPRNVKITYNGVNGVANSNTTVKVSINESETTFVYYKTLEEGSTSGEYPYQVISNPFSVRPSTGTGNSKVYYGFAGWKIISGGEYIKNHNNNDVLTLDEEIVFNNLPYSSVNSTSAEIVFQTTWKTANRTYVSSNPNNNQTYNTSGDYESNFYVINCNYTRTITTSGPVTIMMVEPDGSADYRGSTTFTGGITTNNTGVTKIEWAHWQPGAAIDARGRNLTIGRGMNMDGTRRALYGTGQTSGMNQVLKVESGNFSSFTSYTANASSVTKHRVFFGCDYDRARGDNAKLTFTEAFTTGASRTLGLSSTDEMARVFSLSGSFMTGVSVADAAAANSYYIGITNNHNNGHRYLEIQGGEWYANIAGGMGENHTATVPGFTFRMKGGTIRGSVYGAAAWAMAGGTRRYVITGGTIKGWLAGGANGTSDQEGTLSGASYIYVGGRAKIDSEGSTSVINRAIGGNVFGAGCGYNASSTSGQVTLGTNVVIADDAYVERGVYGGGSYGYTEATSNIYITGGHVEGKPGGVNGTTYQASITGGVFGGACQNKGGTVNIYTTGGIVEGGIHGGSNANGTVSGNVTMHINGGQVGTLSDNANIHGGGYGSATRVTQNVEVTLGKSGQTAPGVTVYGDVYGGSALGYVNGTAATNTYHTYVTLNKGIINGSLYGGALGDGSTAANVYGPVAVKVYGGSVRKTDANGANGSGGVYGCNNVNGAPQRAVSVDIYGTDPAPSAEEYALFAVYGGGNQASYSYGTPTVKVHNCDNSIEYVYGGGNAAHISNGNTDVTIYGGNKIGTVFGGGNGTVTAANVSGNTDVKIYGGTILHVFGGSNERGSVGGSINVNVNKTGDTDPEGSASACDMIVGEVYGGGNKAASDVGNIIIGCTGTLTGDHSDHPENIGVTLEGIGSVYGGANQANISGDITLTMNSGIVGNLFGGNNTSGTISGGIQVDVEKDNGATCASDWYLGNVFGGGNLAQYSIPNDKALAVNILNGTVSGNVYGGGKGLDSDHTKGQVTGNPVVTIGDNNGSHQVTVSGDVYGGGDAGNVVGTPQVNVINKCNTNVANVYGGGNAADVSATDVNIDGGTIGMVFGGGHGDKNSLPQKEANVNGAVAVDVTGGTISKVFGGSNSKGTISGAVAVNIAKGNTSCQMHITEVYGGGNEANGNAGIITIGCTGDYETNGEGIVDVYGGANQADIGNSINLTVTGGHINRLFGGNNTSGNISGTIAVNVNWTTGVGACSHNYMGDVFGGGNLAAYSGSPSVTLTNGTVSGNIYGGGNEAGVGGSTVNINGGAMTAGKGIYGGCNTSGVVSGDIAVNINGGSLGTAGNALYGIFGGGYGQSTSTTGNVTVTIGDAAGTKTPTIYGDIYGGSALGSVNSDASDLTKIDFLNGTLHGNIYGGGLGDAGDASKGWVNGEVQVNISSESQAQANCHIDLRAADIYGCNNTNGSPQADVTVHIWKTGYVTGDYSAQTGSLYAIDEVFGGGNQADYAPENGDVNSDKKATVYVHDCVNSIRRLFGGGNKAAATGIATTIDGGRFEYVFGGGNGEVGAADVGLGGTDLTVHSGRIAHLFGGSNTRGTISGPMLVNVDYEKMGVSGCDEQIDEFFGGGNEAVLGDAENPVNLSTTIACNTIFTDVYGGSNLAAIYGNVTLTVNGGTIQNLYGGSKGAVGTAANITGNVKLNIYGGDIGRAYGGSNINGNITGTIGVDLDWSQSVCSQKEIDYIYGGSNQTAYTPTNASGISPDVKLINGTVNERVYGGGRGSGAVVTSNPRVTAGAAGKNVVVLGSIFGGGDAAQVSGNTDVNVIHSAIVGSMAGGEGNIFGGGNAATVTGDTKVYLGNRAKIYGNVYGGGNQGEVNGDTKVIVNSD